MEGCTGGRGSGNSIGGKDPLCSAVGIGAGNGGYIIHNIGVVIPRHDAVADIRDAVPAGETAAQSLILKGFHGHDADIVGPGLDALAYAGDGARAAHADGDGVHETAALPGDGLHDGGAGHPAMVFGVIVVGKPVHIIPALFGSGGLCQRPGPRKAPLGGGMQDLRPQPEQVFLPQGRGILRHGQHHGVARRPPGKGQRHGKGAGGRFNDGLAREQLVLFRRKGQHPLGHRIAGRAGGPIIIKVSIQPPFEPAGGKIAPQLHDRTGDQGLIDVWINCHEIPPLQKPEQSAQNCLPCQGLPCWGSWQSIGL